uniref:Tyrosine-protein kinase receptor n=1 Tax=Anopheles dirus TaxID=7168 RepID=A0A182N0T5_9DIPT
CTIGCRQWELALESSCQQACNVSDQELLETREWSCIAGCNDGLNRYFRWLKTEIGTPHAPALVADSLTATALALEWEVPERLVRLARHRNRGPRSYLVQWRYEEVAGDWKYYRNQSMGDSSTVRVDNLQPYTKYRFRVALLLSPHHDQVLTSEQSVIISTLPSGVPTSEPTIVRAVAVDHSRISISWEPGPFPNGPVLSYVLQIKDLHPIGYSALKVVLGEIPESNSSRYYMFEKLEPERNYSVSVAMSNPAGEGPASIALVATPPKPTGHEETQQPTLILGAERSILAQSSLTLFSDPPTSVYTSAERKICGTATHIRRGLLFVSDDAGYIYRAPSRPDAEQARVPILTPDAANNFRPTLLSVDWLNEHLYVLGQARPTRLWQIAYCDFGGGHLTVAIAGLQRRPDHFAVDPYNGYLFWVVGGTGPDAGLFRLDLGDISNGVRHEIRPLHVVRERDLGAFTLDHANFQVLLADQGNNTVLAVSLDGKRVEDVRNNTQQPRFERVKSLARANGLFYWTTGTEVFSEEYHSQFDSYFHNAFPIAANNTYFSISVNLTAEQPVPVPVNPPRNLQALASTDKLKVSWDVPYLLGVKGRGAWQAWAYRVQVRDERNGTLLQEATVNGTSYACNITGRLQPNRAYTVRAAAFTAAGRGPWSREFRVRTLRPDTTRRHLVWASTDGIVRSDVIGEQVATLIPRSDELDGAAVTSLAWHARHLYVVSNSTLRLYREPATPGADWTKVRELESVECVAIDWIGERLYYSNPAQQLIVRTGLLGEQPEPIHSVMNVREIRFDAYRGFIYCSSGLILEAFRLNGKSRVQYFSEKLFTGKQIIGMTLDLDGAQLFWIVRSYAHSHLYWAPLAGTRAARPGATLPSLPLTDQTPQGPLLHFSDRLLWLKESQVVVGDVRGENLAYIRNHHLNGTRALTLIEPGPARLPPVNVLPAGVDAATVRVAGDWRRFNVSWAPVENVNYSTVFYKLTLKLKDARDIVQELTVPHFHYDSDTMLGAIAPYTPIDITLHAFTYWRSSGSASVCRHTPAGKPSVPGAPRAYIRHHYENGTHTLSASIVFRWSPPAEPNGPIVGYRVSCWTSAHTDTDERVLLRDGVEVGPDQTELIVPAPIQPHLSYQLQVRVRNVAHESEPSELQTVRLSDGRPLPLLYVATAKQILLLDLDLGRSTTVADIPVPAVLLAELRHERKLFWVNANGELHMHDQQAGRQRLAQVPARATALTVDWVARIVYVRTQTTTGGSTLNAYDLNQLETGALVPAHRSIPLPPLPASIDLLRVLPDVPKLHAVSRTARAGYVIPLAEPDERAPVAFDCTTEDATTRQPCDEYSALFGEDERRGLVQDAGYLYWLDATGRLEVRARDDPTRQFAPFDGAIALLPVQQHQHYPPEHCLVPDAQQTPYRPQQLNATENSITLLLPVPALHPDCTRTPPALRYRIQYQREDSPASPVHVEYTHGPRCRIENLRPYTNYRVGVTLTNYYLAPGEAVTARLLAGADPAEASGHTMPVVIRTAAGPPSRPEHIAVQPISPTDAIVSWTPSRQKNSHSIWYEICRAEPDEHTNRQQQRITDYKVNDTHMSMELSGLQPNRTYLIWVQAHSTFQMFRESEKVQIQTFPEPSDIELLSLTSTTVRAHSTFQMFRESEKVQIQTFPEPSDIELLSLTSTTVRLRYSKADQTSWKVMNDSQAKVALWHNHHYELTGLTPKTKYQITFQLYYPHRQEPYEWPRDRRFLYETMADRPAAPGQPVVTRLQQGLYRVSWEPAEDNGAAIGLYELEVLLRQTHRTKRANEPDAAASPTPATPSADPKAHDAEWRLVYNGPEPYWFIPEQHIAMHSSLFRVRANNSYGWGPYSNSSSPTGLLLPVHRTVAYFMTFIGAITIILLLVAGFILLICQTSKLKNFPMDAVSARLSDVELATLRELPRRGNFVQSNNILYSSGLMPDADISMVARIRLDQIFMASSSLLGSGAFGEVYEGVVKGVDGNAETRVAIKTLKKGAKLHEKQEFLQEAQLMSNFKHKHITRLLGVCLEPDALLIIMELMQGGDLLSYLRRSRSLPGQAARLTMLDLVAMCQDVASGCRYLEEMHFVHRDLACRNCLVSSTDPRDRVVKIGDFGLARDIYKNDYYRKEGEGLLPVRWMSPESLVDGVFTSQSDIWAFGVLLWEIMTLGEQPYQAKNNVEVLNHVREGGHLDRPKVCPNEVYELMKYCWRFSPDERPTFRYCLEVLKTLRANTSEDTQIIAPFPAKLQQGSLRYRLDGGSETGTIATPPTSSSGSSGATGGAGPNTPKYLELVYEDSGDLQPSPEPGSSVPTDSASPQPSILTDNGYEIPITDSRCPGPADPGLLIPNLSVLLPHTASGDPAGDSHAPADTAAAATDSIMEREDRRRLSGG